MIYRSDEAWPNLREGEMRIEEVRYLSNLPCINRPSMLVDFDRMGVPGLLYHLIAIVGGGLLLRLVIGKARGNKKAARKKGSIKKNQYINK